MSQELHPYQRVIVEHVRRMLKRVRPLTARARSISSQTMPSSEPVDPWLIYQTRRDDQGIYVVDLPPVRPSATGVATILRR